MRRNIIFLLTLILLTVSFPKDILAMQHYIDTEVDVEEQHLVLLMTDEIDLIALVCLGEAEGESELGKRLVIDTILNRMDNSKFPSTVSEVCWQEGQFSCLHNGRCKRVTVTDEIRRLVVDECIYRTNDEVLYFAAGGYNGKTHLLKEGGHYFSK